MRKYIDLIILGVFVIGFIVLTLMLLEQLSYVQTDIRTFICDIYEC